MKTFVGVVAMAIAAAPAMANTGGAPVPLIGAGLPVAAIVGAVLVASKLLKRNK